MFSNNTEEMTENKVTVKDSTPPIVKVMVYFIYTGKVPENLQDICGDVLYIAVKYNLPGLVKASELAFFNTLCKENALSTLVIIDRHCPQSVMRKNVIKFVADNILNISDTKDWDRFVSEHPRLSTEVTKCVALKNKTQVHQTIGYKQ